MPVRCSTHSTASICVVDRNGVIVAVNEAWRRFSADNGGRGRISRRELSGGVQAGHRCGRRGGAPLRRASRRRAVWRKPKGSRRNIRVIPRPFAAGFWLASRACVPMPSQPMVMRTARPFVSHQDITPRKTMEFELKRLSETDELTGLKKNRRKFRRRRQQGAGAAQA